MDKLFMEKGTRDFGYNEIAESLLQNRLNNGTEEAFYKGMEQRLRDIPRYTEDDVNKGIGISNISLSMAYSKPIIISTRKRCKNISLNFSFLSIINSPFFFYFIITYYLIIINIKTT